MTALPNWRQKASERNHSFSQKLNLDNDLYDRLKKSLSSVKGQDVAIRDVITAICGWNESKKNNLDFGFGGLVIHMAGAFETGKSMTTNISANELAKKSSVRISYSDINSTDHRSCAEQLPGGYVKKSSFDTGVECNTRYATQLMYNPEVVVQIDEFDKFIMRDDSLQALLWDVEDTGRLKVGKNTYIDCSKTIFLLTSNSSKGSLKVKFDKNKDYDDSNSLESVNFKQAFLNRITSVYFENFSEGVYKEILLQKLKPVEEYYSNNYGIAIKLSDKALHNTLKELTAM